jgi:hypothetical protein
VLIADATKVKRLAPWQTGGANGCAGASELGVDPIGAGGLHAQQCDGYLAKYSTKSTGAGRRRRVSQRELDALPVSEHVRRAARRYGGWRLRHLVAKASEIPYWCDLWRQRESRVLTSVKQAARVSPRGS